MSLWWRRLWWSGVQAVGAPDPTLGWKVERREVVGPWLTVSLRTGSAFLAVSHSVEDGLEELLLVEFVINAFVIFRYFAHSFDRTMLEERIVEIFGAILGTGRDLRVVTGGGLIWRDVVLVCGKLVGNFGVHHDVAGAGAGVLS